jgi:CheY-like chemotaxis protein
LETVLVNLAANARDAMDGQGEITLSAKSVLVASGDGLQPFANLNPGHYVHLSVADTGCGMAPEVLAHASEPFYTTKPSGKGTGLGLAMARGFAEQSGGALHIKSAPGQGAIVSLWFPATAESAPKETRFASPAEAASDVHRTDARVLLVDDEATVREIVAEQLLAAGYTVRAAADASEALEMLDRGWDPNVLIADLSMPDMNGVALLAEAQRRRPGLPAIILTGFATEAADIAMRGAVSGSFSLLRKPIDGAALAERVAALLAGAERLAGGG